MSLQTRITVVLSGRVAGELRVDLTVYPSMTTLVVVRDWVPTYGRRQNKLCVPFRTEEYKTYEQIVPFLSFFHPSVPFRFVLFLKK